eukprot:jgi/Ulvmu1/3766/UM175_0014.1
MGPSCAVFATYLACIGLHAAHAACDHTPSSLAPEPMHRFSDSNSPFLSRQLLDTSIRMATAPSSITAVATPQQLQAAVAARAQDIEIRDHLDLTGLPLVASYNSSFPSALGAILETRSIRAQAFAVVNTGRHHQRQRRMAGLCQA